MNLFNEKTLQEEIHRVWGAHGAHAEIYADLIKSRDALVEALKLIAAQDQGCGGRVTEAEAWRSAQSIARAAIAKAKGGT